MTDLANVGFDRSSGQMLYGWPAVVQDMNEGLLTDFGSRVMREYFGSLIPRALGRNMTPETVLALTASIAAFLDTFEPRFSITRAIPVTATRLGALEIHIEGEYRPRALFGDEASDSIRQVSLRIGAAGEIEAIQ